MQNMSEVVLEAMIVILMFTYLDNPAAYVILRNSARNVSECC